MFIAIGAAVILLSLKFSDWKNWKQYNASLLLFAMGNLYYNFVYHDHFLWKFEPCEFNHHIIEIAYTFTVYPLTALMYLSRMPSGLAGRILRTFFFISVYSLTELFLFLSGRITYNYGWVYGYSVIWDFMTFPMLALHQKRPGIAYIVCLTLVFAMAWLFPYNLK